MSDDVYRAIWDEDSQKLSTSGREPTGDFTDPGAEILLNEQIRTANKRHIDLATHPLFAQVAENRLQEGDLYPTFISLLNNYVVNFRDPETTSPEEEEEIDTFLDIVLATRPMEIAFDYVSTALVRGMAHDEFRARVRIAWFEPYTNHFRGKSTHFCTGFEHVFVGEGKFKPREGSSAAKGEISGYHNWVKFYLDEQSGRVDYLGYKYDLNGHGPNNPNVVTMQFLWNHLDLHGNPVAELFKPKGGFFVGTSPAAEMALGTVAYFDGLHGLLTNQFKEVALGDGNYQLVMYHETKEDGGMGQHIRSFFPKLLGAGLSPTGGGGVNPGTIDGIGNDGPLRIRAALPNPAGDDTGREWVEIENTGTAPADLTGMEVRDKMSRPQPLPPEDLAAGAVLRVMITRATPHMMQMSNKKGLITLHDSGGLPLAGVSYAGAGQGEELTF